MKELSDPERLHCLIKEKDRELINAKSKAKASEGSLKCQISLLYRTKAKLSESLKEEEKKLMKEEENAQRDIGCMKLENIN